jgi:peptide-methionine (S)-S-oxide reductase
MRRLSVFAICFLALTMTAAGATAGNDDAAGTAVFAGGCFWCMEGPFDALDGVLSTTSGYAGGSKKDATYQRSSSGRSGHREVLQVKYDPARVSYADLLEVFWHNIDPYDARGQFCDKGPQYTSAVIALSDEQFRLASESKAALVSQIEAAGKSGDVIATEILPFAQFYPAEDYHQDYYKKNPIRYKVYRWNCGRDARLAAIWGEAAKH